MKTKHKTTVLDWLKNVYYDSMGTHIWAKQTEGHQLVAQVKDFKFLDIRGWGAIQQLFPDLESAEKFQDEIGEFVAQAIREKIEREVNNE